MTKDIRALIASRDAGTAWTSHLALERAGNWRVVGIVDPRAKDAFHKCFETADVILIESEDLIWLLDHRSNEIRENFKDSRLVVFLDVDDILEIVTRGERTWGLLLKQGFTVLPVDRLTLAYHGYLVITSTLVEHFRQDGPRLDIACDLSEIEFSLLSLTGKAISNRAISEISGLPESRVKSTARILARKLRLKNRTALAVFAVENETLLSTMAEKCRNR